MENKDKYTHFIRKYNEVEGRDLDLLTEVQLIGYYVKNFEYCMLDKLLDDINRRVVPYVLGMRIFPLLQALDCGRTMT